MFLSAHMALLSLGVFLLIASNFVWNTSMIAVGILACLMAFFSVFADPNLFLMM